MTSFTAELEQEAQITSRVLGRVPEDKLTWKPHPKSMTLGQLALHTATIPAAIAGITANDTYELDPSRFGKSPQPASAAEITKAFEDSLAAAKSYLDGLSPERAEAIWHVKTGDREIMAMPRKWALRSIMFNHIYHHRGQLSVYLRLLDIPVPIIYGASADESPFR
ncbi:MAG: DinB family protein [Candidatus Acidiferrum sp.]